jgi:hydrogenase nickel incorporation protein HypB
MESVPERISVQTNVLNANQQTAAANRERFAGQGMLVMNLMSAPGAGKTTLLEATIKALQGEFRLAVIEGDLQTDLDAQRIQALGVRAYQITTGTVCHLDARMVARALDAFPVNDLDLLVIENVGNLICPASFDLGESLRVVVCSVAEGPEKPKKYPVMFNKANVGPDQQDRPGGSIRRGREGTHKRMFRGQSARHDLCALLEGRAKGCQPGRTGFNKRLQLRASAAMVSV